MPGSRPPRYKNTACPRGGTGRRARFKISFPQGSGGSIPSAGTKSTFIQEEQSGSGTFSLRLFHGLLNAKARNITAWACASEDYPIVYFVGYRVRAIESGTIEVSREKDIVNVISLKDLDPKLEKRLRVKIHQGTQVLCADLGTGCEERIFYERE